MHPFPVALLLVLGAPPPGPPRPLPAEEMAAQIDRHLAARWKERGVTPAPVADDATFVRRVHLDLVGRIPDIVATRDFLDDPDPAKRARLVEQLVKHPRHPGYWASVWRAWMLADVPVGEIESSLSAIETHMRGALGSNTPYDRVLRGLLLERASSPFYAAHQNRPENLAAATSRLFLGVKLECAQCHNHPFARWTRQQFWEMAAFFGDSRDGEPLLASLIAPGTMAPPGHIRVPDTGKVVRARLLDGQEARWEADPREPLVAWMLARDNPLFARAVVNRYWEHLLGTGLVEPVDEESADNPPSHPALLDLLARQFVLHKYDLQYLLRAILLSRAYQLSSQGGPGDPRLFARGQLRGLTPEQLYDSVATAGGKQDVLDAIDHSRLSGDNDRRTEFRLRFPSIGKRTAQETSSLQALYLMNGNLIGKATRLDANRDLAVLAESRAPAPRRVEQLFLMALSRKPTQAESARSARYVEGGGPSRRQEQAVRDVLWVLLNSAEFQVNH